MAAEKENRTDRRPVGGSSERSHQPRCRQPELKRVCVGNGYKVWCITDGKDSTGRYIGVTFIIFKER